MIISDWEYRRQMLKAIGYHPKMNLAEFANEIQKHPDFVIRTLGWSLNFEEPLKVQCLRHLEEDKKFLER